MQIFFGEETRKYVHPGATLEKAAHTRCGKFNFVEFHTGLLLFRVSGADTEA